MMVALSFSTAPSQVLRVLPHSVSMPRVRPPFAPLCEPGLQICKDRRIRSNVVSPGPINTPLANRQSADVIARIVSTIPMGRMGEPEEVAKVALFLASDDSSFVTGIELFVDGGRAPVESSNHRSF